MNNNKFIMNEIKTILLKEWDPIGIQSIPEAQDEYDSYIFSIYKLIQLKKSEEELFNYLWWIKTEHMGLPGNKQHTKTIVHKLIKISNL
jgi:hypothetical protein